MYWDWKLREYAEQGNLAKVKECLANGADANDGGALCNASENGHFEIVKYLVANGANANARDWLGKTALMYASEKGHFEMVKYLVKNGADVNVGNCGKTAIDVAKNYEVRAFLEKNKN